MNISGDFNFQKNPQEFASLRLSVDKQRKTALKKRIAKKPHATDLEYLLGAFIQMYEPYLKETVLKLAQKGYAIDASSGFGGKNAEFQAMTGEFSIDYVTRNKLEKIGVKFREYNGTRSLIFWPQKAELSDINALWNKITDSLPDKGKLTEPSSTPFAVLFRRKYTPQDHGFRKVRLFEKLKFKIQKKVFMETKKRQKENPRPDEIELKLGLFIEELEPHLRAAVTAMNKKGYSTDRSGFADNPCEQMVEGDFQLDGKTEKLLEAVGVQVDTNPSGYTRLQFSPPEPDMLKIKRKWNKIVSLLPNKKQIASVSMTKKARDFRMKYQ